MILDGELPGIYAPHPECGHCFKTLIIEDGTARCESCLIQWNLEDGMGYDATGEPDENEEGTDVPCLIEPQTKHEEYDYKGSHVTKDNKPCILPSGHASRHLHPYDYASTPIEVTS